MITTCFSLRLEVTRDWDKNLREVVESIWSLVHNLLFTSPYMPRLARNRSI